MRVTILGSGTCVPRLERASSSLLVEAGTLRILVDCGLGTQHRLLAAGQDPCEVDLLFLTHFHPDHTGELVSLLFSGKYAGRFGRKKPLILAAGKGLGNFYEGLCRVYGEWVDLNGGLILRELPLDGPFFWTLKGVKLGTHPVNHRPESLALSLEFCGKRLVITGDTDQCPELVPFAAGADLLICEAAMPDAMKVPGHLTPSLAAALAREAGVSRLLLTHFYPECDGIDVRDQAREVFEGPVLRAHDLMTLDL
ncbi:MBL fold metallo-hydrolase [Desulfobotulus sp.]|uniref:MBL fold metallo-hydrolase n=1 Tax=Desulfobotulus sp. TaxID=1940337 RepID=UPI002A36FA94|nr:MBL fold metallo-hydrolase [Desulfobotulus sp.]MDY0162134.1 MBL fold metallo-hydrolase [Desulfobotulus sp.]